MFHRTLYGVVRSCICQAVISAYFPSVSSPFLSGSTTLGRGRSHDSLTVGPAAALDTLFSELFANAVLRGLFRIP